MYLHKKSLIEELVWVGFCAGASMVLFLLGMGATLSVGIGFSIFILLHLAQLLRLLRYLATTGDSAPKSWAWGLWDDVFGQVRRLVRREKKRRSRQRRFFSRFRDVAAVMPDAVVLLGKAGEVTWCNPQACVYLGLHQPGVYGRRLTEVTDHPVLGSYLETGDFSRPLELEAPSDPSVILRVTVLRFQKKDQQYLLIARDVTRSYHLNRSQREFALNISHELRTPLTVLLGYLETLYNTEDVESPRMRPIQQMLEQARRMMNVIRDLSALSGLEDGSKTLEREPVAVYDMLEGIVEEARRLDENDQHKISFSGDERLLLRGDESLLRTAFSNLIFNAVRHTPIRTSVEIHWGMEEDGAVMQVSDNGVGIAARHLSRLTERFYRVDAGRSSDSGGSGLGLAIARQILDLHDARLRIASEEGRGASFSCVFSEERFYRIAEDEFDGA